jgi:hypothetical protein
MRQSLQKDRFIPLRKTDLIESCCNDGRLDEGDISSFRRFCQLLVSSLHLEYHQLLETLKDNYAPFDPNSDTLQIDRFNEQQKHDKQQVFSDTFTQVLNAANYEQVTERDLKEALSEESLFKVRLAVEFQIDFEIEDALQKLARFGLVKIDESLYRALPLNKAKLRLDKSWDHIFNIS